MTKQKHEELRDRVRWIHNWIQMCIDVHQKISQEVTQELLEERIRRKISRAKCADLMGITPTHLYSIENSKVELTEKIVDGYFQALNGHKTDVRRFHHKKHQLKSL